MKMNSTYKRIDLAVVYLELGAYKYLRWGIIRLHKSPFSVLMDPCCTAAVPDHRVLLLFLSRIALSHYSLPVMRKRYILCELIEIRYSNGSAIRRAKHDLKQ